MERISSTPLPKAIPSQANTVSWISLSGASGTPEAPADLTPTPANDPYTKIG